MRRAAASLPWRVALAATFLRSAGAAAQPPLESYQHRVTAEELNDSLCVYAFSDSLWTHALRLHGERRIAWTGAAQTFVGLAAGQEAYPPEEISPVPENNELSHPLPEVLRRSLFGRWMARDGAVDRPYSGWLYFGPSLSAETATEELLLGRAGLSRVTLELQLGWTGPASYAGQFQTAMHRATRWVSGNPYPRDPQGWEYVSGEDTEIDTHFGVLVRGAWERDLVNVSVPDRCAYDACLGVRAAALGEARLGSVRDDAGLGAKIEVGLLAHDPYQHLPDARGGPRPEVGTRLSRFALYATGSVLARGILFDRHLDNAPFDHEPPERDKKPWGLQLWHGVGLRLGSLELEYLVLHRVKELARPLLPGLHQAGVIRAGALW